MSDRLVARHPAGEHETVEQIGRLAHQVRDLIRESTRPVILTHANPDADAVASALGTRALCRHLKVEPAGVFSGDGALPDNLRFLHDAETLTQLNDDAVRDADLLIFVDCADSSRLGPMFHRLTHEFERKRASINIDHHVTNTRFGTLNLVVSDSASTAELIVLIFESLGVEIEPGEATTMLAGIYGDTLGLRTPATTPATLRACADLVESGADLDLVVDYLFRMKPYSTICLWAEALQRTQWHEGLIWTQINPDMLERAEADRTEAEGIVNFLAGTIGARAAALLYLESWGWRVSMRTLADDVDVSALLSRFNGGGHPRAAGARLAPGDQARDQFLDEMARLLGPRTDTGGIGGGGDDPV